MHDAPPPAHFRAYVVEGANGPGPVLRAMRDMTSDELPAGDVTIDVEWSSINYKDGLAVTADGHVARISPLVPGIDLAGTVASSSDERVAHGAPVIVHGHDLGSGRHGGYAERARVPAEWLVPLPDGMDLRIAMAIGTAGFTAALGVEALETHGVEPGRGPVLVTGASGGVGRIAVELLAQRGHEVWAATGKADQRARLRALGVAGFVDRDEVTAPGSRPLESARWTGGIDTVGAPTLPYLLRTARIGGVVAACGNAGGAALETSVLPFILRGVALLGLDSANIAIEPRRRLWQRLATDLRPRQLLGDVSEIGLDELDAALDLILAGKARGRTVVRVGRRRS